MGKYAIDPHFRNFAFNLENAVNRYGDLSEENLLDRQCRQMETLVSLESDFMDALIKSPQKELVLNGFMSYICDERKNILSSRPFFRERQAFFTENISRLLKSRYIDGFEKFHINYRFVKFVTSRYHWDEGCRILDIKDKIQKLRTELVEMNMPLAISRARIFWSRTPKSQLSYMDLIQITAEGLLSAIDKFVLPFGRVFRAVVIGRMTGNMISSYSDTILHFFPIDKRKIYRANKIMSRSSDKSDYEGLAAAVNVDIPECHQTTGVEISQLLSAASCVSTEENTTNNEIEVSSVHKYAAPASCQPDIQFERAEAISIMDQAISKLTVFERKLLRLKGVVCF